MTASLDAYLNTLDRDPQACTPLADLHRAKHWWVVCGSRRRGLGPSGRAV
jgi:hypothetical protein